MKAKHRILSMLLALILMVSLVPPMFISAADMPSAISPREFSEPSMEYRPGVRWWWPGGAAETEDLVAQVDYLADNFFGAVEIVAFSAGFLSNDESHGSIYKARQDFYDEASILDYDTPAYYEKLERVIERAAERGIIVDLNAGSGYLANDDSVDYENSTGNMALGRSSVEVDSYSIGTSVFVDVPEVEISPFYILEVEGRFIGEWKDKDKDIATLNAVIIVRIENDQFSEMEANYQLIDFEADNSAYISKPYKYQYALDYNHIHIIDAEDIIGSTVDFVPDVDGNYEVIAVYSVPTGSVGLNSIIRNPSNDKTNYVADHMDPEAIKQFVTGWIGGNSDLDRIVNTYGDAIRAVFNDSYEFYTDVLYNQKLYERAKDGENNVIGYNFTRFLPLFYQVLEEAFILNEPTSELGDSLEIQYGFYQSSTRPFLTLGSSFTHDEFERLEYDYHQLIDQAFQDGMEAFSGSLSDYNLLYRQQAYNPPIDTLKSSKYVDIPETEGEQEYELKRVSSGAHLYGKNLVTSEVYTLGNVPFQVQPQKIKRGYDLMATSGVNNFFYHGLNAPYYGDDQNIQDGLFGEEGWRAWPTIGVEMAETNSISPYFKTMNEYAARANYVMQSGQQSSDVALYMPLFGQIASTSLYTQPRIPEYVTALESYGYVYDAINDDTIQNRIDYTDGKLRIVSGIEDKSDYDMEYSALVVADQTLPVETMEALKDLAHAGAPIIFYGDMPNRQPSYVNGNYEAKDDEVKDYSQALLGLASVDQVQSPAELDEALSSVFTPAITYDANANVRMNRRTFGTGGELAYIRNASQINETTITLHVDTDLPNTYWLDQSTGNIYNANVVNGTVTIALPADGAIILLAEPDGVSMPEDAVSAGTPLVIASKNTETTNLTNFTLAVTADNIGAYTPGATQTKLYTGNVLGNWADSSFQNGDLQYVSDPGRYQTTFYVADKSVYANDPLVLDLGGVSEAATVYLNGDTVGRLYCAPYEIDLTASLKDGPNDLVIEVQPLRSNRRAGLYRTAIEDPVGDLKYLTYKYHFINLDDKTGEIKFMDAGLQGPVTLSGNVDVIPPADDQYAITVNGGTANKATAQAGETITITATVPNNQRFVNWATSDVTLANANAATTTFVMPARNVTVTANFSTVSSGSGRSSGNSSGGSSSRDTYGTTAGISTLATQVQENPVDKDAVVKQAQEILANASTGDVVVKNATSVSADTLKALADAAGDVGGAIRLLADTVVEGKITGRLYINPEKATLTTDILLGISVLEADIAKTYDRFSKYFENKIAVVSLAQQGEYGMEVEIAAKVDLTGLDTENLVLYSYDRGTNTYHILSDPGYYIDSNNYLHFKTTVGYDIIISEGALQTK